MSSTFRVQPQKEPEFNAFSKINLNALDSDSDGEESLRKKRQEDENKYNLNKSGYQRPFIDTESMLRSIQQSFEPHQDAYSPFDSLLNPIFEGFHSTHHPSSIFSSNIDSIDPLFEITSNDDSSLEQFNPFLQTTNSSSQKTQHKSKPHQADDQNDQNNQNNQNNPNNQNQNQNNAKKNSFDPLAAAAFGVPYSIDADYQIFDEDEDEDALTEDEQHFLDKFDLTTQKGQLVAFNALTDYILAKKDKTDPYRFGSTTTCDKNEKIQQKKTLKSDKKNTNNLQAQKHPHHLPYCSGSVTIEEIDSNVESDGPDLPEAQNDENEIQNGDDSHHILGQTVQNNQNEQKSDLIFGPRNKSYENYQKNTTKAPNGQKVKKDQTLQDSHIIKYPLYKWSRVTPDGHIIKKVLEHGYSSVPSLNTNENGQPSQQDEKHHKMDDNAFKSVNNSSIPRSIGISYPTSYISDLSIYNIHQEKGQNQSQSQLQTTSTSSHSSFSPQSNNNKKNTFASLSTLITDVPSISLPKIKSHNDIQTGQPQPLTRAYGLLSVRLYDLSTLHQKHSSKTEPSENENENASPQHTSEELALLQPELLYSSLNEEVGILLGQNQSLRGLEVAISTMNVGERAIILSSSKYGGKMEYLGEYRHTFEPKFVQHFCTLLKQIHPTFRQQDNLINDSNTLHNLQHKRKQMKYLLGFAPPINPPSKVNHSSKKPAKPQFPDKSTTDTPYFTRSHTNIASNQYDDIIIPQNASIPPYFRPGDRISNQVCELTKPLHIIHNITYEMIWNSLKKHKIATANYFTNHMLDHILPNRLPDTIIPPFEGRLNTLVPNKPMQFLHSIELAEGNEEQRSQAQCKSSTENSTVVSNFKYDNNSIYKLYSLPYDQEHSPLYAFLPEHAQSMSIPFVNDKHYQDIIFSNPNTHSIVQQLIPDMSKKFPADHNKNGHTLLEEEKKNPPHSFLRKLQRVKLPGQPSSAYLPNQMPSAQYGASSVANGTSSMTAGQFILEFDFSLTRYEKEINLHTMTRIEKINFIQQRRLLGKLLYTHYQKYQSAIVQYTKAVTVVEDDFISEHQAHNNDAKPEIHSGSDNQMQNAIPMLMGGPKPQVLPQLTPNERKHLSILLYTNIIQSFYQTAHSSAKYNAILFYISLIFGKFQDTMNVKILYYKYRILWYLNDIYQAHYTLQLAISKSMEVQEMFESGRFLNDINQPMSTITHTSENKSNGTMKMDDNDLTINLREFKSNVENVETQNQAFSFMSTVSLPIETPQMYSQFPRYQDVLSFLPKMKSDLKILQKQLREEELTKTSKMQGFLLPSHYNKINTNTDDTHNKYHINPTGSTAQQTNPKHLLVSNDTSNGGITDQDDNNSTKKTLKYTGTTKTKSVGVGFGTDLYTKVNQHGKFEVDIGLYDDKPYTAVVKDPGSWKSQSKCEGMMNGARLAGFFFCQQLTTNWNKFYDYYFAKEWSYRGKKSR